MFTKLWYYDGIGRPVSELSLDTVFQMDYLPLIAVAMNQQEMDYLSGLQLMYGKRIQTALFRDFHDEAWDISRRKVNSSLDQMMAHVVCSYVDLSGLMIKPHGDLIWQRELERKQRIEQHIRRNPQGIFI